MKLKSNPKQTVLTITVSLLVISLVTKWHWPLAEAGIIGLAELFSDLMAIKTEWLWIKLTCVLSLITPNIHLVLIFFC